MSTRATQALGKPLAALAVTAGLTFGTVSCTSGATHPERAVQAVSATGAPAPDQHLVRTGRPLAELQGQNGLSLAITSAQRNPAGYLTVRADLTNDTPEVAVVPAELRGNELEVLRTGPSLAGATLVDFTHNKRYYVLRDTDGRPLTTTGLSTLKAGEKVRVFMQFPAPPANTATVGFQLPLFDTATIKISG
jgi:hypothetical protein